MKFIIILIGLFTLLMGVSLLINPDFILGILENNIENQGLYVFGVLFRTVVGILLVLSANESKHPTIISAFGYFSLFAALMLVVSLTYFGQESVQQLFSTLLSDYKSYSPIIGGFSVLIGGFLIYAFVGKR